MRTRVLFLLALLPSIYILLHSLDMPLTAMFGDDTIYFSSAKSLAEGSGYRIPSLASNPFQTKYPPLFPLMLAMVWKLNPNFPANLALAAVLSWAAIPFYLFLAWRVFLCLGLSRGVGLGLVFVLALNPQVLLFGTMMMAEMWFGCALLATVLFASRANQTGERKPAILAGVTGAAALMIKSSALPLLITLPLGFVWRKQFRYAGQSAIPMVAVVAVWSLWVRSHTVPSTDVHVLFHTSYLGYYLHEMTWSTFVSAAAENFRELYYGILRMLTLDPASSLSDRLMADFVLIAGTVGAVRLSVRCGSVHYLLFALGYLTQLALWNVPTPRLLLPILPLFLAGIGGLIVAAFQILKSDQPMMRAAPILSIATAAGFGPLILYSAIASAGGFFAIRSIMQDNREAMQSKRSAYDWIVKNTPADAGVLACDDQLLYLYTGRHAASQIIPWKLSYIGIPALRAELQKLPDYARERGLNYVLVTSTDLRRDNLQQYNHDLDDVLQASHRYRKVYNSPLARIYQALN